MKFDNKIGWFLFAFGSSLIIMTIGINYFMIKSESKSVSVEFLQLKKEKAENGLEWLCYQEVWAKISGLNQGWKRPIDTVNSDKGVEVSIPIKDAVTKQINEIKRIHQEEILGKLSNDKRVYDEYRLKLYRDLEYQYQEKLKTSKSKLEAELVSERKRQDQARVDFRKNLERKHQLTLINLELQKKMLIFNPINNNNQENESKRIELEITRIREELKEEIDQYQADLEREFELYQKQKTAEYNAELSELRRERRQMLENELSCFQKEQDKSFQTWKEQRQTEVEHGIKLRRIQQ